MQQRNEMPEILKIKRAKASVRIPNLVSLKELMREDKEQELTADELPKEGYTQQKLTEAWMDFAYVIKKNDLDFFSTLSSFLPVLEDSGKIMVTVHNSTQDGDINQMKAQLLPFVRKELNNFEFDFDIFVNKQQAKEVAVTPQEKYAKLVDKNPLLEDYRKKLGLGL